MEKKFKTKVITDNILKFHNLAYSRYVSNIQLMHHTKLIIQNLPW